MKYLQALQSVAQGYRGTTRHVQIRKDRSVGLYPSLGKDIRKHDCLVERIRRLTARLRQHLRSGAIDSHLYENIAVLQDKLTARRAGTS